MTKRKVDPIQREQILRDALFVPCDTMEHLHLWIKTYLGLDLPDCIVCDDDVTTEPTNSSPMHLVWELYSKMRDGTDENFQRVLAYASRGGYKCVEKGTRILTNKGLSKIEDIHIGDTVWTGVSWRPVTDHIHDGVKDAVTLTTTNGITLTTSPIHRVWTWSPGKLPGWKRVSELTSEDIVCLDTNHPIPSPVDLRDSDDYKKGYLCGLLTGDGCLTMLNSHRRVVLTTADSGILAFWKDWCQGICGRDPKNRPEDRRRYDYYLNSVDACRYLQEIGMSTAYSWGKKVPEFCFSTYAAMVGFICGLLDTDGSVSTEKGIILSITSKDVVKDVMLMLQALGVNSSIRSNSKLYGGQRHLVHTLTIPLNDVPSLGRAGIQISAKKANSLRAPQKSSTCDAIPKGQAHTLLSLVPSKPNKRPRNCEKVFKPSFSSIYPSYSRQKLIDLVSWAEHHEYLGETQATDWRQILGNKWVGVASVDRGHQADFYDLSVDTDHSYWSNGLISHNTVACSVIEVLALLHLNRNVAHAAAIESQAAVTVGYLGGYFKRPIIRDFLTSKNKRTIEVTRYIDPDGKSIPEKEWSGLPKLDQESYTRKSYWMKVVVATVGGFNAIHVPLLVCDELDLIDPEPLREARGVPCRGENGELPLVFMTSSRKFSFGEVQKIIDSAHKTQTALRHWSIIDVAEKCAPSRHLPEQGKIPLYYNENTLASITKEEWEILSPDEQDQWIAREGYVGCIKNCSLFAICRGRAAEKQKSNSKLLLSIPEIRSKTYDGVEFVKSQLMGWKPSAEGLIYPNLNRARHMLTPEQMYSMISGEIAPRGLNKAGLISYMKSRDGLSFHIGGDWGYSHFFALSVGALYGNRLFIFDALGVPGLEVNQKIELCKGKYWSLDATWYMDPEDRSSIESFKRAGFRCKKFDKEVILGIDSVRDRLLPGFNRDPEIFFLQDEPGVEALFLHLSRYHWVIDPNTEKPTAIPDERDDDLPDSLRYLCQNLKQRTKFTSSIGDTSSRPVSPDGVQRPDNWLGNKIRELVGGPSPGGIKGKKGRFFFDG